MGLLCLLTLLLAPGRVGGDGVGYLTQIDGRSLSPGHIAYLPLARLVAAVLPRGSLLELVLPLRLLSLLCVAGALLLVARCVARDHGPRAAALAAGALGSCHAVLRAAHEVEVYGVALLAATALLVSVVGYRRQPTRARLVAVALLAGAAPLFHLTLALLSASAGVVVVLATPGGRRGRAALAYGALAATVLLPLLALACAAAGARDFGAAWAWLRSSDHGLGYPLRLTTPLVALWGLAKSIVYAPYPYQAPLWRVVLESAPGAVLLLGWIALALRARREQAAAGGQQHDDGMHSPALREATPTASPLLPAKLLALLATPLALFGVLFYPSDTERWVFILPAVALSLAPALGRGRGAPWLVVVALAFNAMFLSSSALDDAEVARARRVEQQLRPRDLLISPGHGYAELVGLGWQRGKPRPAGFALTYWAGAKGRDASIALLHTRVAQTLARGGRVFVARLDDRLDRRGFKELEQLGIDRARWLDLFRRYRLARRGELVQLLGTR
ncbi:MAG: hypothetical protein KC503_03905 [Myxococcales bacterium]|nr:hypothetical protein [Myxococcales bacterium]